MSPKQKRFCQEYIIDFDEENAALRAGYQNGKYGSQLLENELIQTYIYALQNAENDTETIAGADEVLSYLTNVMRGESESDILVVVGEGVGVTKPEMVKKKPDHKERLKAAELLGKNHTLFIQKKDKKAETASVVIEGEEQLLE